MFKPFLIRAIIIILSLTAIGGYFLYRSHKGLEQKRQNAKAPEQTITLIEGWTTPDIAAYLEKKGIVKAGDFLAAEKSFDVSAYPLLASRPAGADLQGFLFPDTYRIAQYSGADANLAANAVIKKALDNFSSKLTPEMQKQAQTQGQSVYQILILASIIEKETGQDAVTEADKENLQIERKIVAGIFYNRLNAGMPLQSDATVNYFTGKNDTQVSLADAAINDPYNTYKFKGLPPGPICNPSLSSILAALYPTPSQYFYFLSRPDTGQAVYSKTFEEHLKNKQKYLK